MLLGMIMVPLRLGAPPSVVQVPSRVAAAGGHCTQDHMSKQGLYQPCCSHSHSAADATGDDGTAAPTAAACFECSRQHMWQQLQVLLVLLSRHMKLLITAAGLQTPP